MTKKRLLIIFLLLLAVFLSGIAGYMIIEGWGILDSLYMTVITLASVGFMEVHDLSSNGRVFTIFLIIFGMGILLSGISTFTAFLVEGELSEILRRRKMNKQISLLRGHFIVCGIGGIGRHIVLELHKTGRQFVAIDRDDRVCKDLEEKGFLYMKGDATSIKALEAANAKEAGGLFSTLPTDAENLLLIMTARGINQTMRIISKAEQHESEEKMFRAGANGVVLPEFIGGLRMASEMVRPEAVTFLDKMLKGKGEAVRVEDITVSAKSRLSGLKIKDSGLTDIEGLLLVALRKGERYIINPRKEEMIDSGDVIVFIGDEGHIRDVRQLSGKG